MLVWQAGTHASHFLHEQTQKEERGAAWIRVPDISTSFLLFTGRKGAGPLYMKFWGCWLGQVQEESAKSPPQSCLVHSSFARQQSLKSLVLILLSSIGLLDSGKNMWFALAMCPCPPDRQWPFHLAHAKTGASVGHASRFYLPSRKHFQ